MWQCGVSLVMRPGNEFSVVNSNNQQASRSHSLRRAVSALPDQEALTLAAHSPRSSSTQ